MEGKNESRFTKSAQFVGDPVHLLSANSSDEPDDFPSAKGIRYWHDTCASRGEACPRPGMEVHTGQLPRPEGRGLSMHSLIKYGILLPETPTYCRRFWESALSAWRSFGGGYNRHTRTKDTPRNRGSMPRFLGV